MIKLKFAYFMMLSIVLIVTSLVGCDSPQTAEHEPTRRPDFSLPDLQGKIHANSEWDGKIVVVNFWATWCPPCIREIPMFIEMQEKYADRGLQFVGVAVDTSHAVQTFVERERVNYPILLGDQEAISIAISFGDHVGGLPFTAIVDRQGYIVLREIGEMRQRQFEQVILPLLVN